MPVVTALVDDLSGIDAAASSAATRASLLRDLARARSLGPPGGALNLPWANALTQVGAVAGALGQDNPAQDLEVRTRAEAATEALVSFVASTERARA